MKAVYSYEKDEIEMSLHIDNISRIRQKGDNITLITRNEKGVLQISEREMRKANGVIELYPDDVPDLPADVDALPFS